MTRPVKYNTQITNTTLDIYFDECEGFEVYEKESDLGDYDFNKYNEDEQ